MKVGEVLNWKKTLLFVVLICGSITALMHLLNRLFHFISVKDDLLRDEDSHFYQWRFGSIHYTKRGQGKPLLLIHDLNTSSSGHEWHAIEGQLAKTNTVYTLDLLGCGRSDKPSLTYTSFLYVQLIADFIKNIIGEPVSIVATGASGAFTVEACKNNPTQLDKILLVNPKPLFTLAKMPCKKDKVLRTLFCSPILGTFLYNLIVNQGSITRKFRTVYYSTSSKVNPMDIRFYLEASQKNKTRGKFLFACIITKLTNSNLLHSLTGLNNSVFIIAGQDVPRSSNTLKEYQSLLPSIEAVEIKKCGFLPQLECPEKVLEHINLFFDL